MHCGGLEMSGLVEIYRLLEGEAWNVWESNPGIAPSKVDLWFI